MPPKNEPEQQEYESYSISDVEIEMARQRMSQKMATAAHNWRQSGTLVNCTSCPFGHGFALPVNMELTGIDDNGKPILTKRW